MQKARMMLVREFSVFSGVSGMLLTFNFIRKLLILDAMLFLYTATIIILNAVYRMVPRK